VRLNDNTKTNLKKKDERKWNKFICLRKEKVGEFYVNKSALLLLLTCGSLLGGFTCIPPTCTYFGIKGFGYSRL
jgi:hypothetical protein